MSVEDERDLREQLGTALHRFTPGPAPLNAVVGQGRTVMIRRRMLAAFGLAAVAAAAVITPFALRQANQPPAPAGSAHYWVAVSPPGPGSSKGLVAYGTINHQRWQLAVTLESFSGQQSVCFGGGACRQGSPAPASASGSPVSLTGSIAVRNQIDYGTVRTDVAYVQVKLTNGQALRLRPVAVFGRRYARYVAFAVPFSSDVTEVSAFSKHTGLGYAIPFTAAGNIGICRWLRPGQPALPAPATYKIGSGTAAGHAWSAAIYVGPWGTYIASNVAGHGDGGTASECYADFGSALKPGQLVLARFGYTAIISYPTAAISLGQTAPSVSYLILSRADGGTIRVQTVWVGRLKFGAYVTALDVAGRPVSKALVVRWTAYDDSGRKLGSGTTAGR